MVRGRLLRRYKRFLADVELPTGETITAHCANSGSMLGCCEPGSEVLLSHHDNPKRKLKYGWEAIHVDGNWVGVNTALPNRFVGALLRERLLPPFSAYEEVKAEVKMSDQSRLDFRLDGPGLPQAWLEIKNVTLRQGNTALFPDSVTQRGARHMLELAALVDQGHRAAVVFTVQRIDCERFAVADDIDAQYGQALRTAVEKGVEVHAVGIAIDESGYRLNGFLPVMI